MEKDTLYKFFDGKASQEEKKAVRAWLEATPQNEKRLFREREFFDAMILSGKTRTATSKKKSRPFYLAIMQEAMKVVAIFAIVITCGVYFYQSEIRKINQSISTITVPAGQRVNLALPDGTSVWLNARSKMSYPAVIRRYPIRSGSSRTTGKYNSPEKPILRLAIIRKNRLLYRLQNVMWKCWARNSMLRHIAIRKTSMLR